jgi:hypothetical protein
MKRILRLYRRRRLETAGDSHLVQVLGRDHLTWKCAATRSKDGERISSIDRHRPVIAVCHARTASSLDPRGSTKVLTPQKFHEGEPKHDTAAELTIMIRVQTH